MPVPSSDTFINIDNAAHSGAFGNNPLPLPTDKQLAAGNYKKGKINLHGLRIAIEQPQYSYRTGIDKSGKRWACRLAANYGYILGTKANDGKPVDCFIGSYPQSDRVYVINQYVNGKFDEHKVMLCYLSESFARSDYRLSYERGWNGLHSMVELTIKQFKQWLKHGNMTKPLNAENLPITEIEKMKPVHWTDDNQPAGTTTAKLIYDLQALDKDDGLLLDSISADDYYHDFGDCMLPESAFLDSLNMPYSQLERRMNVVRGAFNRAGTDLKVAEPGEGETSPQIIGPFKKDGVTMITALFNLTDGQTVSIVFHNPDSTPAKITPTDTVIAWKWMLNKKDITIIVAPEKGEDLKPMDVAKRIMKLAEKNSAAFQRANGKVSEQNQAITDLKTEITELESRLAQAQADYEVAKQAADDREVAQATNPTPEASGFVPTHTFHDSDLGQDVLVMRNEDGNWQAVDGTEYVDIDNEVEPIGAVVKPDVPVEPEPDDVVTSEPEQPTQGIDPVAKSNIEAANVSAAIKKKAIAYLNANPTSHKLFEKETPAGKKAYEAIMESVGSALFAEIKALSPLIKEDSGNSNRLVLGDSSIEDALMIELSPSHKLSFYVAQNNGLTKNLFDSTQTLEDLKSWGFALPFDLDVKAFVNNVIKPVVDEFLAKQASVPATEPAADEPEITDEQFDRYVSMTNEEISALDDDEFQKVFDALENENYHTLNNAYEAARLGDFELADKFREVDAMNQADDADYGEVDRIRNELRYELLKKQGDDEGAAHLKELYKINVDDAPTLPVVETELSKLLSYIDTVIDDVRAGLVDKEKLDSEYKSISERAAKNGLLQDPLFNHALDKLIFAWNGASGAKLGQSPTNSFDADIEVLRSETDYTVFNDKLDELIGNVDAAGLMAEYEPKLNDLADLLTELLKKAA